MVSVTALYELKTFASEGSKLLPDICLADSRILYFWYVLKSIHKFIKESCPTVLIVRGSNKKQNRGSIISNFTKGETFSSLMTTKYSWGLSHNAVPLFAPIKKSFFSPSVWAGKYYTWTLNWKENLLIYFENCQDVPYSLE